MTKFKKNDIRKQHVLDLAKNIAHGLSLRYRVELAPEGNSTRYDVEFFDDRYDSDDEYTDGFFVHIVEFGPKATFDALSYLRVGLWAGKRLGADRSRRTVFDSVGPVSNGKASIVALD